MGFICTQYKSNSCYKSRWFFTSKRRDFSQDGLNGNGGKDLQGCEKMC